MLLVLGIALALQTRPPQAVGSPKPDTVSKAANRAQNRRDDDDAPRRRPVTAKDLQTAFKDPSAKSLLDRARRARLSQDSALVSYDASAYQRISAGIGFSKLGRDRLIFRTERADRVRWHRDAGIYVDVLGARTALPGIPDIAAEDAGEDISSEADMVPIPYFPGNEPLWFGSEVARTTVDENGPVHPLAEGSEAYYTYRTGDSISIRLPGDRVVHIRELEIRPREPKWNLVVGSLWFDIASGQLARGVYRFAVPMHIDAFVREQDPDAFEDVPAWIKPALFPMKGEVSVVTIDYGMYEGRFWLPRSRIAEGIGSVSFMRVPFKLEQRFTYASVNGLDSLPKIAFPPPRPQPPDSLSPEAKKAWRDSATAARVVAARARRDSLRTGLLKPPLAQCDTSATSVTRTRRFGDDPGINGGARRADSGGIAVLTRVPCNLESLKTSAALPASIFDPSDVLFDLKAREALIAEALSIGVQPPFTINPAFLPKPTVLYGLGLTRYNRVEGLSTGITASQIFGGGYTADAGARIGSGDLEPNVELTITRSNLTQTLYVSGYNRLVSARDWGNPLSFGSSVSAALFGRDEGFYYRTSGVAFGSQTLRGTPVEWKLFVERQRTAAAETEFALMGNNAIPNITATTGVYPGFAMRVRHTRGEDPRGLRLFTDVRGEAAGGDSTYGRIAVDLTFTEEIRGVAGALTLSGGSSIGSLPLHRRWFLGGVHTVRGQSPDTAMNGSAYWLTRTEIGKTIQGARPLLFTDIGWVGDRSRMGDVGRPMSGVGVGVGMMDGLIRFDVARGLHPLKQWRVDMYLEALF